MEFGKDFYVFEVTEYHKDRLSFQGNNQFFKGERFIGWEDKGFNKAFKSNMQELVCIPLDKVKKVYKINFERIV